MEEKNLEVIKSKLNSLDSVEKLEKLEIVHSAFKIVTKDVLNDYGIVMFDVLDAIFGDEKTPSVKDEG